MDREWLTDGSMQIRFDILFKGLPLPRYVFHLMSVAALQFDPDPTYFVNVANNGVTIQHGRSTTHLLHDWNDGKVTVQLSTPIELIGSSWKRLIGLTKFVIDGTISVWKATRPVLVVYCSHCLFKRVDCCVAGWASGGL